MLISTLKFLVPYIKDFLTSEKDNYVDKNDNRIFLYAYIVIITATLILITEMAMNLSKKNIQLQREIYNLEQKTIPSILIPLGTIKITNTTNGKTSLINIRDDKFPNKPSGNERPEYKLLPPNRYSDIKDRRQYPRQ